MSATQGETIQPIVSKLPLISDSPSLVSSTPVTVIPKSLSAAQQAAFWAADVRARINDTLKKGDIVKDADVRELIHEFVAVCITALQQDSHANWMYLCEVFALVAPYAEQLRGDQQVTHYLERLYSCTQKHKKQLFDVPLLDKMALAFPKEMARVQKTGGNSRNYRTPTPPQIAVSSPRRPFQSPMKLPNGSNPFLLEHHDDVDKMKPRQLCIGDLAKSLPAVVAETSKREAVWSEGFGLIAQAMDTELPERPKSETKEESAAKEPQMWSVDPALFKEDLTVSEEAEEDTDQPPLTGKEVVEMFGKGRHLGEVKFVYLNKAPSRYFRPYDLIAVPKHKADREEHWVMSCFGVLHVYKSQPSETMTLHEWHRECVLWNAITKLPFFKLFLVKRAFNRWKANMFFNEYCRIRHHIDNTLIGNVPSFGAALLQISKLLQELGTIQFLPLELTQCYTLAQFEQNVHNKKQGAETLLEKFFNYCKLVVDMTCEQTFEKLRFCETQAKHQKAVISKESLYIQRVKKEQREENFKLAREEAGKLGNFVRLVDQMLLAHLVALARANISTFVGVTMQAGKDANRDALFKAKLIFTAKSVLTLYPSKEKISKSISEILHNIPNVLCEMAQPMDLVTQAPSPTQRSESPRNTAASRSSERSETTFHSTHINGTTSMTKSVTLKVGSEMRTTPESRSADTIAQPTLPETVEATKSVDNFGVATPDLCLRPTTEIMIGGQGFMGQYSPLSKGNLADKLSNDEKVSEFLILHKGIVQSALTDVDQFCEDHTWLADIHKFVKSWTPKSCKAYKRAEAYSIETKLGEIRGWTERVKNVLRFFVSENGLLYVDCGAIQDDIIPGLTGAFRDLLNYTAGQAKGLSIAFSNEVQGVIKGMKEKNTDIEAFAEYAKQYITYKNKMAALQSEVEYIKSLFEVIRLSYRALTSDEEKHEEKVWQSWEAFLLQLQDASDFVNTQTPIKSQELEDTFLDLTGAAERICRSATTGPFLDPTQNPTQLLAFMKELRDQFHTVQTQMIKYSAYREAILGEPYDVSSLTGMLRKMEIRAELWKYVEVSTFTIQDWMRQLFRKFQVTKTMEKITEWQHAAGKLKDHLPQGDKVLAHWYKLLNDFKQDLPLLQKLSSDSLKPRHWKALFVGMGQLYQSGMQYTVADLLAFNLSEHSLLINTICSGAVAEFALEQSLNKLKKMWEEKELQLAKHIPIVKERKKESVSAKGRRRQKQSQEEQLYSSTMPDMYTLTRYDELKYQLQDNQVTIQTMIGSPHLAELRSDAEFWANILQQIEDMIDLWVTCQSKWQYLSKVFSDPEMVQEMAEQAIKFEDVDLKFQEVMKSVVGDPKVMSILSKRKGQKGWRELQGENLKKVFQTLIRKMEEILKSMDSTVDNIRSQFPRLFFLSNEEIVEMVSISRNTKGWMPYVCKCFPGIQSLGFSLPPRRNSDRRNTALDLALHADKLQVTTLEGEIGESVKLATPLEAKSDVGQWLVSLETNMRTTLGNMLRACVETRLNEGLAYPEKILEELGELEVQQEQSKEQEKLTEAVKHSYRHWLLRFPAQVVLITEALFWERDVLQALKAKDSKEQLKVLSESFSSRLDQYLKVLHDNCHHFLTSHSRARLQVLLGSLINQSLHQRDIVNSLLSVETPNDKCFDWLKVLRYHMDMKSILCAKPQAVSQDSSELTDDYTDDGVESEGTGLASRMRMVTMVATGHILDECEIQQMAGSFLYEYEYNGPTSRLVMTPLTDRCHLTLTLALKGRDCGAVMGPTGTGKSQTIRDLAKTMGRHCVTFNCSESLHTTLLNRLLSGVIQAGSWLIWDNADRIPHSIMSVLGQKLDYIKHTYRVLEASSDSQYGARGISRHDKSPRTKRRNSLTTLHSLPVKPSVDREKTFPNVEKGQVTNYFEETFGDEEEGSISSRIRRHSISKAVHLDKEDYYPEISPIPLFGEMHGPALYRARFMRSKRKIDADFGYLTKWSYTPNILGNVLFNGNLMPANGGSGCFMTLNSEHGTTQDIPHSLRLVMRPVAMVKPDRLLILEAMLCYKGFHDVPTLARKVNMLYDLLEKQLPDNAGIRFGPGLRSIKVAIQIAAVKMFSRRQLHQIGSRKSTATTPSLSDIKEANEVFDGTELSEFDDESVREEAALLFGIQKTLLSKLHNLEAIQVVKQVIRTVFPQSSRPASAQDHDPVLVNAVQEQMVADKLQANPQHVAKILQLYECLQQKCGVMLVGASGSGKTTCYQTLSRVLNMLHNNPPAREEPLSHRTAPLRGPRIKAIEGSEGRPSSSTASSVMDKVRQISRVISAISLHWYDVVNQHTEDITYPRVDVSMVYPGVLSMDELFGSYKDTGMWKEGIVPKLLHEANAQTIAAHAMIQQHHEKVAQGHNTTNVPPSVVRKWIIMDGQLSNCWVDNMNTLLDEQKKMCVNSGEQIDLMDSTSVLFETCNISGTSPALLGRCAVVYCSSDVVQWKMLFESWLQGAKGRWELFNKSLKVLTEMVEDTFPATIKFLSSDCSLSLSADVIPASQSAATVATGIQEVTSFLNILSSLFDKFLLRDKEEEEDTATRSPSLADKRESYSRSRQTPISRQSSSLEDGITPNHTNQIIGMFILAYIWGFGGHLHQRSVAKFDRFVRHRLNRARHDVHLPGQGTVFDYMVEPYTGLMISWREYSQDGIKTLASNFTIVPEAERYSHLIDLLVSSKYPVLLTGPPGVGKTALMQNLVHNKHYFTRTVVSLGLDSAMLQQMIESKLEQVRQRAVAMAAVKGSKQAKMHHLFFLDDVNATAVDKQTGSQPCLELLREMLSHGGVYDRQRLYFKPVDGAKFIAAAVSPGVPGIGTGTANQIIHPRLARLFTILSVFPMSSEAVHQVYGKPLQSWLEEFPAYSIAHHYEMAHAILSATLDLYHTIKKNLTPTPVNAHYVFTHHDIARCVSGMFLLSPRSRGRPKPTRRKGGGTISTAGVATTTPGGIASKPPSTTPGKSQSVPLILSDNNQGVLRHSQSWTSMSSTDTRGTSVAVSPPMMRVVVRLWCHEVTRTYFDRLITEEDRGWFTRQLHETVEKHFCTGRDNFGQEMETIQEIHEQAESESEASFLKTPERSSKRLTPLPSTPGLSSATSSRRTPMPERSSRRSSLAKEESKTPQPETVSQSDDKKAEIPSGEKPDAVSKETEDVAPSTEKVEETQKAKEEKIDEPEQKVDEEKSDRKDEKGDAEKTDEKEEKVDEEEIDKQEKDSEDEDSIDEDNGSVTPKTKSASHSGQDSDAHKRKVSTPRTGITTTETTTPDSDRDTTTESRATTATGTYTEDDATTEHHSPRSEDARKISVTDRDTHTGNGSRVGASAGILRQSATPSTPGVLKPNTPRDADSGRPSGAYRRGVTFKPGLIGDASHGRYHGPLLSMDQICLPGESLSDIIFSQYLYSANSRERGYSESSDSSLMDGVQRCLLLYNEKYPAKKLDLVLFKEALLHVAKLTRVLSISGGNALLLGKTHCTGRGSLTKLAAYAARCRLYETRPSTRDDHTVNRQKLRQHIKEASHMAGLQGKPVVLLVRDVLGKDCLLDISAVMREGTIPNLYTEEEIDEIATTMLPGSKGGGHRGQRLEMAVDRFYRRVCNNMHVVMCMDFTDINYTKAIDTLQMFPTLLTHSCCVDVYFPWTHDALVSVATQWMRRETKDKHSGKLHYIPWRTEDPAGQISAVCHAMAYIHQSSEHIIEGLFKAQIKFFTPVTFLEFIDLFKHIASKLARSHKKTVIKFERALSRINVAYDTISSYNNDVDRLTPMLQEATRTVEQRHKEVDHFKAEYQKAKEECARDEEEIAKLSAPLENLKKHAQEEKEKVDPIYEAALEALKSLDPKSIEELRTYAAPPVMVINVVNALCLLFKQPYDWASGKALICRDNFFEDLEFYDKENMPDEIFHKLNVLFIQDPEFRPEVVMKSSVAAAPLCRWVHAVYAYIEIHRNLAPKLEAVAEHEAKIEEALKRLGEKRVKYQQTKIKLEHKIQAQKEAQRSVRTMERNMKGTQSQIAKAANLVTNMTSQNAAWKAHLTEAQNSFNTAPGDALLAAACVCYHGPMEQFARDVLLQDWLDRCRSGKFMIHMHEADLPVVQSVTPALELVIQANKDEKPGSRKMSRDSRRSIGSGRDRQGADKATEFIIGDSETSTYREGTPDTTIDSLPSMDMQEDTITPAGVVQVRENFSLQVVLSTTDEQSHWHYRGIPQDTAAVQNALIMRSCAHDGLYSWPLLVDPDKQAEMWVRLLQATMTSETPSEEDHEDFKLLPMGTTTTTSDTVPTEDKFESDFSMATGGGVGAAITDDEWMSGTDQHDRDTRLSTSTGMDTVTGIMDDFTPRTTSMGDAISGRDMYADSETATDIHPATEQDDFEAWDIDIDPNFVKPADGLLIVPADDRDLNSKIVHAVAFGLTLMIMDIERQPLDYALYDLLHRNITMDKEGKQHVKIGGNEFEYHQDFRLFLVTFVPLGIKGPGLLPLPIQHTSVVDLSVSQQAVFDRVLRVTLSIERPEYENQYRSIESDLRHYKQQLKEVQDDILDKTLNLKNSILEQDDMLPALIECQQQTFATQTSLAETQIFKEQLDEKRKSYVPVAKHGSVLFSVIKHLPKLHPLYQFNLQAFLKVVQDTLKSRSPGKTGAVGLSPKARASELVDVLTHSIHRWIATAVSSQHSLLFAFLVAMEKLRMTGGVANQEWSIFVDGITMEMVADPKDISEKPDWMSEKAWLDFGILEELEDFEGLRDSMIKYNKQWQEYFEGTPVLISLVPDDNHAHLNMMQKAILWRIMQPHLLSQLCQDITVYQLGASIAKSENYDIEKTVEETNPHIPIVFLLPASYRGNQDFNASKGHCLFDPVAEVMHYAKDHGMEGHIHTVSMGTEQQMDEAVRIIKESSLSGDWVILNNCHLVCDWSKEILQVIKDMIEANTDVTDIGSKAGSRASTAMSRGTSSLHMTFRLMMVTQADTECLLPGLVIQHSHKVNCATSNNFKTLLQKCYNQGTVAINSSKFLTSTDESKQICDLLFSVSLLHTILNNRRSYQRFALVHDCYWSEEDFKTALHCLQAITSTYGSEMHRALQCILGNVVYGGHASDKSDQSTVEAVAEACLLPAEADKLQNENLMGVSELLRSLLPEDDISTEADGSYRGYQEVFDNMKEKMTANQLGLAETANVGLQTLHSGNLLDGLKKIAGISTFGPNLQMDILDSISQSLEDITTYLQALPPLPQPPEESLSHISNFLASEVCAHQKILNIIHTDVHMCVSAAKGEIACTSVVDYMLNALKLRLVPQTWLPENYPSSLSIENFFEFLGKKIELLGTYCDPGNPATAYNLAVFEKPDVFIQCLLMEHARSEYLEAHQLTLRTQVLGFSELPPSPPDSGVYITGLHLHNALWDSKHGHIVHEAYKPSLPTPTQLPVVWLKPVMVNESDVDASQDSIFRCPVIVAVYPLDKFTQSRVIGQVELPCLHNIELCQQRRVYTTVQI
ncbi:dynein heavy chain domain-containing protein 1-like isoform X2 [Ptychodera flava]|uniref:dynein heavy chain domain-containing protein 1-like isoform X2 n=1 Tax=Ptychodera flava TaxID=63121 RepID=UPI00396A8A2D